MRHFLTRRRLIGVAAITLMMTAFFVVQNQSAATTAPVTGAGSQIESQPAASDAAQSAQIQTLPVQTIVAQRVTSYASSQVYTGTVTARRTSDLGFDRSARVVAVLVDEGQKVKQGEPLARLDADKLTAQRDRIEAQRLQAQAVLAELTAGPRSETIAAARADLQDLQAQVELESRNFSRTQQLLRQNAASRERLDETQLGLRSREAKQLAAQNRLDELVAGTRSEQIDAQSAIVDQLSASLAEIDIQIADSVLPAPFDGTIAARNVDEGTVVMPGQTVLSVVETVALEARIGLPALLFKQLATGQSVRVEVGGESYLATFRRALPNVDLRTRTRTAIFVFDPVQSDTTDSAMNRTVAKPIAHDRLVPEALVPGQIARVSITQQRSTDGFWLPTAALIRSTRGLWAAYVAEPSQQSDWQSAQKSDQRLVSRRDVEILHTDGERTLVRGLINEGDHVIASGTHRLSPGQMVFDRQATTVQTGNQDE